MTEEFPWNSALLGGLCRSLGGNVEDNTHTHTLQECLPCREELACRKKDTFTLNVLRLDPPTPHTHSACFYSHLQSHSCLMWSVCHCTVFTSHHSSRFLQGWKEMIVDRKCINESMIFNRNTNHASSIYCEVKICCFLYDCNLNLDVFDWGSDRKCYLKMPFLAVATSDEHFSIFSQMLSINWKEKTWINNENNKCTPNFLPITLFSHKFKKKHKKNKKKNSWKSCIIHSPSSISYNKGNQ